MIEDRPCSAWVIRLFHRRWMVPLLAELHRSHGSRFVVLTRKLGTSRSVLRQTLKDALAHGWVMENPGHGHPLRPEYLLTPRARRLGSSSVEIHGWLQKQGVEEIGLRKWSMPIVSVLADRPNRFGSLRARLPGITDRALTLALDDLIRIGLVRRQVLEGFPPANEYSLHPRARPVAVRLERLLALDEME